MDTLNSSQQATDTSSVNPTSVPDQSTSVPGQPYSGTSVSPVIIQKQTSMTANLSSELSAAFWNAIESSGVIKLSSGLSFSKATSMNAVVLPNGSTRISLSILEQE